MKLSQQFLHIKMSERFLPLYGGYLKCTRTLGSADTLQFDNLEAHYHGHEGMSHSSIFIIVYTPCRDNALGMKFSHTMTDHMITAEDG